MMTFVSIIGGIVYAIFSLIPNLVISVQDIMNQVPTLMVKVENLLKSWQFDYVKLYQYDFSHLFSQNSKFIEIFSKFLSTLGLWIS